jgi:hypothetical protein
MVYIFIDIVGSIGALCEACDIHGELQNERYYRKGKNRCEKCQDLKSISSYFLLVWKIS